MRRREFIGLIGTAALSFPRPGYAQTKTDMPLVGLLMPTKSDMTAAKERVAALRKGLQEAGFVEGTNYSLAVRFAEGDMNRIPELAKELGALKPRVIVVVGAGIDAVRRPFPEMPLVFYRLCCRSCRVRSGPKLCAPGRDDHRKRDERGRWRRNHDPKAHRAFQAACP